MQVHCISVSEHVWVVGGGGGGGWGAGGGVGGCYQPGVYVPLKALFLVVKKSLAPRLFLSILTLE